MEGYVYIDLNPSGPGYVVGVARGANAIVKLFNTDELNFHGWVLFDSKREAVKLLHKILDRHPSIECRDQIKGSWGSWKPYVRKS